MRLQVARGRVLSVVVAYTPNCSTDYLVFLESLGSVLETLASGDPRVLLEISMLSRETTEKPRWA